MADIAAQASGNVVMLPAAIAGSEPRCLHFAGQPAATRQLWKIFRVRVGILPVTSLPTSWDREDQGQTDSAAQIGVLVQMFFAVGTEDSVLSVASQHEAKCPT